METEEHTSKARSKQGHPAKTPVEADLSTMTEVVMTEIVYNDT
jgi:hypothetical protein